MSDFELVTLRNGRRAVKELASGEIMHPSVGPWDEANRLYVQQSRLAERLAEESPEPLRIYDVGLGGGANAAAALSCPGRRPLELISFDTTLEPLGLALEDAQGFPFLTEWRGAAEALMREGEWRRDRLRWRFLAGDFRERLADAGPADLIFFDPFSPRANPALWSVETFRAVRERCSADAQLFTYSAATPTRVALLVAGFYVGAGLSIGDKSETTVASTRLDALASPLDARWLDRWRRSTHRAPHGNEWSPTFEAAVSGHAQFIASSGTSDGSTSARR